MCLFITATLPKDAKISCVAPIFERYKLSFEALANSFVLEQLEPGEVYVSTTSCHCDCGSILGSLAGHISHEPQTFEHEIKKFRGKGWSEAKIQRWLEQKEQTKEKQIREDQAHVRRGTHEAAYWIEFISAVLSSKCTSRIGLLLHFYKGGVDYERIKILKRARVKLEDLTPKALMEMDWDILYEFVI